MRRNRLWLSLVIASSLTGMTTCPSISFAQQPVRATAASAQRQVAAPKSAESDSATAIVATVDGEPIYQKDLAKLALERYGQQTVDHIVDKHLILQACQSQNIAITQAHVDDEIGRIAGKFKLTPKMYLKLIEEERDITPEQYAADIVWPMLALRELAKDKVQVAQADIDSRMESQFGAKVQVRMIVVRDPAKAAELHAQVSAAPDTFKAVAKQVSEDPTSASVEGLLPPVRHTNTEDPLEKVAFALRPNQISHVFTVGDLSVMLQCVRHIEPTLLGPDQRKLHEDQIRSELEDEQLREVAQSVFAVLRQNANVQIVYGNAELMAQYPNVAAILNRQPLPLKHLEDECIKRYGPSVLEVEIHHRILDKAVAASKISITQQDLNNEVARAADYYGFLKADGTADVDAWLTKILADSEITQDIYMKDVIWPTVALKKLVVDKIEVTEADIQESFEHDYGPRAEVLAVVCSNQRVAQEVWELARNNNTEEFFGQLAAQYSVEPNSRNNLGKVPAIRKNSGMGTVEKAAFTLKPGELSGIQQLGNQFVILRGQGQTKPVVTDVARVRPELEKDVLERKTRVAMEQHMNHLLAITSIDNFLVPQSQLGASAQEASLKQLTEQR